jgi:hypothetical protein
MQIALVSTFAAALTVLPTWVARHRALGVTRFYLFVDNPKEQAACEALALEGVTWFARDEALVAEWRQLPAWDYHQQFIHQVYARQCVNVDFAIRLARAEGMDWLIHLDLDECLHLAPPWTNLADYFGSKTLFDMVRFTNHEGVPEHWHVGNYLEDVTLFKKNFTRLDPAQQRMAQALFGERYFLAYYNGKGAMSLHGSCQQSAGVHEFQPAGQVHFEHEVSVLHYTNCGFNWYYTKYATLGDYDDRWLDLAVIGQLFPIMEESRQAVVRGSIHDATALYERQLLQQGGLPYTKQALIDAGVLLRIGSGRPRPI